MTFRALIIRCLLRVYPFTWRAEYGEELGALLATQAVTPAIIFDVVLSAVLEHFKRDQAWKVCGGFFFAWTIFRIAVNNTAPQLHEELRCFDSVSGAGVLFVGCVTVLNGRGANPVLAALKASLLGAVPELIALILWITGVFHPLVIREAGPYKLLESRLAYLDLTFPTAPQPRSEALALEVAMIIASAVILGSLGGLLGRVILRFPRAVRLN